MTRRSKHSRRKRLGTNVHQLWDLPSIPKPGTEERDPPNSTDSTGPDVVQAAEKEGEDAKKSRHSK
jgi:hypothetical protein